MDASFKRIMEQLERKKDTHPHLVKLWKSYIMIKKERFLQYCLSCDAAIEKMNNRVDIDPHAALTLTCLMSHYTTDLNRNM